MEKEQNEVEVETITDTGNGMETARKLSSENLRNLTAENLRNFTLSNINSSPMGMSSSFKSRKLPLGVPGQHTYISANEHISNLLQSKKFSESTSDMSVSSVDSSFVSPLNRRKRTTSASLGDMDPAIKGTMSRSSSTLSLASTGVAPLDSILKRLRNSLSGQIFSGWYTERRYIDPIERYKDVVLVDAGEHGVIKQVKYAIRKSFKLLGENTFIGLAFVEDECRLYVNLGAVSPVAQYPFGHFWFQIRHISFIPNVGYSLELFVIRQFVQSDSENCWKCRQRELESQEVEHPPVKLDSLGSALLDIRSRIEGAWKQVLSKYWHPGDIIKTIQPHLNRENFVKFVKLLCVLCMTLVAGVVSGLKHGGNFVLKTLHELAYLVDRSTPLALGTLNILSKLVGGFYLLLAMMWRDSTRPSLKPSSVPPPGTQPPAIQGPIQAPGYCSTTARSRHAVALAPRPLAAMDNMYSSHRNY